MSSSNVPNEARVIPLRPATATPTAKAPAAPGPGGPAKEPLWRHVVGDVLRRERQAQERTLKDVAEAARISMPYLSELERGRKEASSEVLAAAAQALGLGLADLLALAHDEVARPAPVRRAGPAPAPTAEDGRATSLTELTGRGRPAGTRAAVSSGPVLLAA
ncbi:helix-turn-helix domain-containing protein [Streptomyces johnsoniae]|uniref:Helix-turn-helix transcriptional regulator n=1 Tax=Streptomyces johnsoniae TaxID=3075532 RepID=A0ABU2SDC8_9ACTN|nr:helix-turn-helix transcriptional regulator [Streptomyces sp. DSM 41886]MDT0446965.1 helix-turn-helix transcriptional regulator [Streptomyces sp. DSM 41886]